MEPSQAEIEEEVERLAGDGSSFFFWRFGPGSASFSVMIIVVSVLIVFFLLLSESFTCLVINVIIYCCCQATVPSVPNVYGFIPQLKKGTSGLGGARHLADMLVGRPKDFSSFGCDTFRAKQRSKGKLPVACRRWIRQLQMLAELWIHKMLPCTCRAKNPVPCCHDLGAETTADCKCLVVPGWSHIFQPRHSQQDTYNNSTAGCHGNLQRGVA